MNLATPPLRDLATRLLALESESGKDINAASAFRVCGKLGVRLTLLAGAAGFRSLLARALVLAQAQVPWLLAVQVLPDGRLEGLGNDTGKEDLIEGEVALVAQLLGLLHTFIGEPLTMQLVKEAWPGAYTTEQPEP